MPQPSPPSGDARFAVQLSKLVVHPSPPRSMLEHTAKDGPEDASLKHVQNVCILRSEVRRLEVFWTSTVGEAHSMPDSPEQYVSGFRS